jgi:hypothetical protein
MNLYRLRYRHALRVDHIRCPSDQGTQPHLGPLHQVKVEQQMQMFKSVFPTESSMDHHDRSVTASEAKCFRQALRAAG